MLYTLEDIAKHLKKNKLSVRHWVLWDEENGNKYLPSPIKIIGNKRKIRIYDEQCLKQFEEFSKFIQQNIGLMAEYNKKHFWKK